MRGKGEGAVYRVPKDTKLPLKYYTGTIELPPLNGERRRKVIRRKNKKELLAELDRLRGELRKRGDLPTAGQTCEQWFTYWVEQIAAKEVRPNTLDGYRRAVKLHIIPAIGKVKLEKLTPAHIRRVHDGILAKGLSSTTALLAHRIMSTSLKIAVREGRISTNPAALTNAPRKAAVQLDALDLTEAIQVLELAAHSPNGALWATALLTGARRGEVIGLERNRIDDDAIDLSWQLQRIAWEHGCGGTCGRRKQDCPRRTTTDVPADYELRPIDGGLYWTRPKSSKSWRIIPLFEPLRSILRQHLDDSPENPWGLVFTRGGRPYGPDLAGKDWRKVLAAAGIDKDVRLHDVRHTTVDLLYAAGIPEDIIMLIVGHSNRVTTRGYRSDQNRARLTGAFEQFSAMIAGAIDERAQRQLEA